MGMLDTIYTVPICIHSIIRLMDTGDNNYIGAMSILQGTDYNNMTVQSEWRKIMELGGYEDGLVIDNSGVAENFMNTMLNYCYREIQIRS